jgi:hypothetical protein
MSYPYSSLYLESRWAKYRLAQEFRNALVLLRDAIDPDGVAQPDYPMGFTTEAQRGEAATKGSSSCSCSKRIGINGTGFGASPSFDLLGRAAGLFAVHPTIQD